MKHSAPQRPTGHDGWNPWRTLRRLPYVTLERRRLERADAMLLPGPVIVLDSRLGRRARCAALAHELVHLSRGGGVPVDGMPPQWRAVVDREEQTVDRLAAAARLVPAARLRDYLVRRESLAEPVTTFDVADEFDVAPWVADVALRRLTGRPVGSPG